MEMKKMRKRGVGVLLFLLIVPLTYILHLHFSKLVPYHAWEIDDQSSEKVTLIDTSNVVVEEQQQKQQPWNWKILFSRFVRGDEEQMNLENTGFSCHSSQFSLLCAANQLTIVDTTTNNITVYVPNYNQTRHQQTIVKPYGRQENNFLVHIKPVNIIHGNVHPPPPPCQFHHHIPAAIFSSAYVGNTFHEFSDLIIPLFLTTRHFKSSVMIILDDYNSSFVEKFRRVLSELSDYDVMNPSTNGSVHCFPGSIVGLAYHGVLSVDPGKVPGDYSMPDFKQFLKQAFRLKYSNISQIKNPTLLLLSRAKSRRFLNKDEMITMIRELGFRVIIGTDKLAANTQKFSRIVNSCNVLVGAHGAGLTNELFLPAGGVTVQLELLGLEFASSYCFGNPAMAMEVRYVPYRIEVNESTLVELYGAGHQVIVNPGWVYDKGYEAVQEVYLDQQNLRVNIVRFRETLVRALELVREYQGINELKQ